MSVEDHQVPSGLGFESKALQRIQTFRVYALAQDLVGKANSQVPLFKRAAALSFKFGGLALSLSSPLLKKIDEIIHVDDFGDKILQSAEPYASKMVDKFVGLTEFGVNSFSLATKVITNPLDFAVEVVDFIAPDGESIADNGKEDPKSSANQGTGISPMAPHQNRKKKAKKNGSFIDVDSASLSSRANGSSAHKSPELGSAKEKILYISNKLTRYGYNTVTHMLFNHKLVISSIERIKALAIVKYGCNMLAKAQQSSIYNHVLTYFYRDIAPTVLTVKDWALTTAAGHVQTARDAGIRAAMAKLIMSTWEMYLRLFVWAITLPLSLAQRALDLLGRLVRK